ncbi:MAG: glycosyltransferase [Candidatus Aenigmatarchaeota archaeon]
MRLPFVSVIIPTLNEEKLVENCLKSVKNQDYEGKYEIIVADGKSKDRTVEIAKKYADKIVVAEKRGIAVGRNAGAKVAKGEILLFVDADTILCFNVLSEISKAFKARNVVGVSCPVIPLSSKVSDFLIYWIYDQLAKASIKTRNPHIAGMCCAYRKDAFEKVGGFNEKLKVYEDVDLSKRISKFGKIVFIESTMALTSPRRIEAWGRTKAAGRYVSTYLSYLLRGKSIGYNKYKPIR